VNFYSAVPVSRPFIPPIEEYTNILKTIWENYQLTNGGPLLLKLLGELKKNLDVPNVLITANGTLSLQLAIRALGLTGEIITTPFSYISTSSSIVWEGCTPVFVDIEYDYWCIDPDKIEAAITKDTTAILATHVFGNPCNVAKIKTIAAKHNLKIIYDAAHAFGVQYFGESIFNSGDISICSFHATKVFHMGEGGALITADAELFKKIIWMHNLGHNGQEKFYGLGTNAKATELQAAMGLAVLPYVNWLVRQREERVMLYDDLLNKSKIQGIKRREHASPNYSYYPVLFENEDKMLSVKKALNAANIYPRRYFYPALNNVNYLRAQSMPIAEDIASRILCLPLYHDLAFTDVTRIAEIINSLV